MAAKKSAPAADVAYIARQDPDKRALLATLRALVVEALPDADVSIKWGVPVYQVGGRNVCAIASFKEHVALNLFAPASAVPDPDERLEGGKTNRTLRVRTARDIPAASVRRWVKAAARVER